MASATSFEIFLSSPDVGELEQQYVGAAMRSGWVAPAGPDLDAFEREVASRVGVRHAVGLSSGTSGLHLALVSWGVGPGDVVPVSTFTFAATVNAIRYVGAEPHLVDCDAETGNMCPDLLEKALEGLREQGKNVPVVVPVDMLGKCADYGRIIAVAKAAGARVLADSAEAFGARRDGRAAGSFGDAAVLSFNGNKIMTTSGGGMLLTDDADLAAHVRKLSTQAREAAVHYEHEEVGYNYRLSNILAALGRAQLTRLDEMVGRRRRWRERYRTLFDFRGAHVLGGAEDSEDNCWLTAVVFDREYLGWGPKEIAEALAAARIESRPVWKPMHKQPIYRDCSSTLTGASDALFESSLTLPSGSAMTDEQFDRVERTLRDVMAKLRV